MSVLDQILAELKTIEARLQELAAQQSLPEAKPIATVAGITKEEWGTHQTAKGGLFLIAKANPGMTFWAGDLHGIFKEFQDKSSRGGLNAALSTHATNSRECPDLPFYESCAWERVGSPRSAHYKSRA
jgi:hypothetical protein